MRWDNRVVMRDEGALKASLNSKSVTFIDLYTSLKADGQIKLKTAAAI